MPAQIFPSLAEACRWLIINLKAIRHDDPAMTKKNIFSLARKKNIYYIYTIHYFINQHIYRMRLNKYTHKVVLYISIALFISYFVLTSVPKFDTEENKIYFKSLYIISFVLLIIYSLLKNGKK